MLNGFIGVGRKALNHFLAGSDIEGTGFSSECWLGNDLRMKLLQMTNRNGFGLEGRCNKPLQLTNPFLIPLFSCIPSASYRICVLSVSCMRVVQELCAQCRVVQSLWAQRRPRASMAGIGCAC